MRAIGVILAAGNSRRMKELTAKRATAAMPMWGTYRAIDFVLTNMADSGVQKVAVLTEYNSKSLSEHLNSAKWWDFGRKIGGLFVYHPTITPENSNWSRGTIDSMYQNISYLKDSHEPYVIIASGDGCYRLDYSKVLEYHIEKRADITVVTSDIQNWEDPDRFGQVSTLPDGRIRDFEEKPALTESHEVNTGVYIIRRRLLIELLEACMEEDRYDFVRDVIIRQRHAKRIYAYHMDSYWSNIASVNSYYHTNMDFLRPEVRENFFGSGHTVLTKPNDFPPAKYNYGCYVRNALVASGTIINGTVENSIIFKKSYIGDGCVIRNSIILNDVYIGDRTVVENCIVESHNTLEKGCQYIGDPENIRIVIEKNLRLL
ncbi:MAG: glucose-1-phosphate adenylyltransferase subunit GlgD [Lachnospiraceae bacterium]|nr:glucose-1-phosphate adenylyltransferase subunit GlgD [Lachnospiraceae bacterium]